MSQVSPFARTRPPRWSAPVSVLGWLPAALVLALPAACCQAQIRDPQRQELTQQVQALRGQLQAERLPDLETAQQQLQRQVAALDTFLRTHTSPANHQAWWGYLQPDPLLQAIDQDQSASDQGRLAVELLERLRRNLAGLNLPAMRRVRDAAQQLVAAARFADPQTALPLVDRQLESLAERIAELDAVPTADDAAAVSAILSILSPSGQIEGLPATVRSLFGHPNLRVFVGQSLIARAANRPVLRDQPLRDCILGTRLVGRSHFSGQVVAQPIRSVGAAMIQVTLAGNFHSRSIGYNGPVSLNTVGFGDATATRLVVLDDSGLRLEPAYATVSLDSRILSINHPLKLVRRIAAKQAAKQKTQANRIAADHARAQIGGEFARQTNELTERPPALPLEEAREIYGRLGLSPPTRAWGSDETYIRIAARQAESYQLLAAVPPPPLTAGLELALQLHESLIDNVATEVLAGRTMTQQQLQRLLQAVRPQSPQEAADAADAADGDDAADGEEQLEPFEIDFSRLRPVIFEARDDTIRVGVRGTRFSQGGRALQRPLEITATYRPVVDAGRVHLQRIGEVDVDFPGGGRLSITQVGLRANIQRVFDDIFPPRLLDQPIALAMEPLQGVQLHPALFSAADGWVSVGLR